jgi:hypothetical protein
MGTTFFGSPTVTVGDGECLHVDVVSSPLMKCRLPLGSLGPKDVKVTIDGVSDTLTKGYRYTFIFSHYVVVLRYAMEFAAIHVVLRS